MIFGLLTKPITNDSITAHVASVHPKGTLETRLLNGLTVLIGEQNMVQRTLLAEAMGTAQRSRSQQTRHSEVLFPVVRITAVTAGLSKREIWRGSGVCRGDSQQKPG